MEKIRVFSNGSELFDFFCKNCDLCVKGAQKGDCFYNCEIEAEINNAFYSVEGEVELSIAQKIKDGKCLDFVGTAKKG